MILTILAWFVALPVLSLVSVLVMSRWLKKTCRNWSRSRRLVCWSSIVGWYILLVAGVTLCSLVVSAACIGLSIASPWLMLLCASIDIDIKNCIVRRLPIRPL